MDTDIAWQAGFGLHGAATRADALARIGIGDLRRGLALGRWSTPWRGVLIESERAGDPLTLASAAVAFAGPRVVLAGPTAGFLHGLTAVSPTPIHLMTPYEHPRRSARGLVVHNGPLPDDDRTVLRGLPALTFDRVVTDLACRSGPAEALAVFDEALRSVEPVRQERLRAALAERLVTRADPRGTRLASRLLELATGRAESPAESWVLWRVVDAGFPVPEANWWLTTIDGRPLYRLDLAWVGQQIAVEYHGYSAHAERRAEDEARIADIRSRGWIVIEIWAEDLHDPSRLLRELDDAFAQRGVVSLNRQTGALRHRRHREGR